MFDMITNIFRNLASKPATRNYPIQRREPFSRTRGKIDIDISNCVFCGLCSRKCPSNAIVVNRAEKFWELDPFKCIICGECVTGCPKKCISMDGHYNTPVYNKSKYKYVQQPKVIEAEINDGENRKQETA